GAAAVGEEEMRLAAAVGAGAGGARWGIEGKVVPAPPRRRPVERAWRTVRLAAKYRSEGVVAVGLAGDEAHPAAPFADVFHAARDAGLHRVPHAGEALGADSIRAAPDL